MFSKYKYLIVNLFFPPRFCSGNFFLIAPFSDRCLLVPFSSVRSLYLQSTCKFDAYKVLIAPDPGRFFLLMIQFYSFK